MAGRDTYDTFLTRGDSFDLSATYKTNGAVVNLTGFTAEIALKWKVKALNASGYTYANFTKAATVTAATGGVAVNLTPAETAALPKVSEIQYQLRIKNGTSVVTTILGGTITVHANLFEVP